MLEVAVLLAFVLEGSVLEGSVVWARGLEFVGPVCPCC